MKKISAEFWQSVNPAFACMNELVALPEQGDSGFREYFEYKANAIIREKKIFSSFADQNKLMLEFPEPECTEPNVFEKFYESPIIVARNHDFEGLFAIDISNYTNRLDHDKFLMLISYIKANPQTVFILFFYSNNDEEINNIYKNISHHMEIVKTKIPEPTAEQLAQYTVEGLKKLCEDTEEKILDFLKKLFSENKLGYDSSDYLIRHLNLSGFKGTLDEVKKMVADVDIVSATGCNYSGLGY